MESVWSLPEVVCSQWAVRPVRTLDEKFVIQKSCRELCNMGKTDVKCHDQFWLKGKCVLPLRHAQPGPILQAVCRWHRHLCPLWTVIAGETWSMALSRRSLLSLAPTMQPFTRRWSGQTLSNLAWNGRHSWSISRPTMRSRRVKWRSREQQINGGSDIQVGMFHFVGSWSSLVRRHPFLSRTTSFRRTSILAWVQRAYFIYVGNLQLLLTIAITGININLYLVKELMKH